MRRSLFAQIQITLFSFFLLVFLVAIPLISSWVHTVINTENNQQIADLIASSSYALQSSDAFAHQDDAKIRSMVHFLIGNPNLCTVSIQDAQNTLHVEMRREQCHDTGFFSQLMQKPTSTGFQPLGYIHATANKDDLDIRTRHILNGLFLGVVVIFLCVFWGVSWVIQTIVARPITALIEQIHAIQPGDPWINQLPEYATRELHQLVRDTAAWIQKTHVAVSEERRAKERERDMRILVANMEQQYEDLFSSVATGIALFHNDQHCYLSNCSVAHIMGLECEPEGVFGMTVDSMTQRMDAVDAEQFKNMIRDAAESRERKVLDLRIRLSSQQSRWIHFSISPHENQSGVFEGLLECIMIDVTDRKSVEEQHRFHAEHDGLTGLLNRRAGLHLMTHEMRHYFRLPRSPESGCAVVMMDLDRFKWINDQYGHDAGDKVLRVTAEHLNHMKRSHDLIARLGGDEFVMTFMRMQSQKDIQIIAHRLIQKLIQPVDFDGTKDFVGASMGIAWISDWRDEDTIESVIELADHAMYKVKRAGRGGYCIVDVTKNLFEEPVILDQGDFLST